MSDPFFFKSTSELTVDEIAELTSATLRDERRGAHRIANVAPLDLAGPGDLTFIDNAKYADALVATRAGACLMSERFASRAPAGLIVLISREPYRAFVTVTQKLFPQATRPSSLFEASGIAAGATVHPAARLENGVTVDPGAVIGPRAEIGAGTLIGANAVIGPQVRIGRNCAIGSGATVTNALIGDRVIVHAGCRIGQDGFGYVRGAKGHAKVPQIARVIIQDEVEIGAGTTIDRGGMRDTVIGEGTKIDNLVQIGHNVAIGRHCILVAQCGISGSAVLADGVILGGQVGVADHARLGEGAMVSAQSGLMPNEQVPAGERWFGSPAIPSRKYFRALTVWMKMAGHDRHERGG